ncbi:MAG: D-2-hydroxyacid dehydrogenase [Saprospiraceae bacterium]|nr:D-2-hydroxyacid dehydrogenase [Saprospiraceae bacterium]MBK6565749.1 D-2-hydroxyacid dehydrogenase [Saprospiraceae bacterium]MBK7525215.1 D-2-hydroxyacid dehydrogenase [Saprospiraceae bacterium]MBK8082173.1 D-2-hydroxyacid dehydrogenase [Saprospiraceae bacterium]MBK8370239.1 D-2-hydroxyacid dehydrogenase [Saprospiraceae bacterium]
MKVLVNDGIEESGKKIMEEAGIFVDTNSVSQEKLSEVLPQYDAICVRSNTKVRKDLIDLCPNLKAIGRGGVGLDNIDVEYAKSKGIAVINTPAASSRSVAELVFAHALSVSRFLHMAHKEMPVSGHDQFSTLKKNYAAGFEMTGKTMGVFGLGKIGQELVSIALGFGMDVLAYDPFVPSVDIQIGSPSLGMKHQIISTNKLAVLRNSDYISLHIPALDTPILDEEAFAIMKEGVIIINASRGESVDEEALLKYLDNGKIAMAGLDVFMGEPKPDERLLHHPKISTSPHIGASTLEAQNKIGIELGKKMVAALLNKKG